MKRRMWAAIGSLVALILISTMGTVLASGMTGESTPEYATAEEQPGEIRDCPLRDLEQMPPCGGMRPGMHPPTQDCIMDYLESAGLTDEQLDEIAGKLDEIAAYRDEIKEKAAELKEQGASCEEIREEIVPMMEELKNLHAELVEMLEDFGIDTSSLRESCSPPRFRRRDGFRNPGR